MLKNKKYCKNNSFFQKKTIKYAWWFLLLLICGSSLYWMLEYDITNDEAVTYILFSSKGPFIAASFYPTVNNHFLFSIASTLFFYLPLNEVFALRLTNFFVIIGFVFSLNFLCKKHFNERILVAALSIIAATAFFIQYSFLARGYLYLLFFASIATHLYLDFSKLNFSKKKWFLFAATNALGFYCVFTYLYFWLPLMMSMLVFILVKKNHKGFISLLKNSVITIVFVLLLIAPVILISGLGAINGVLKHQNSTNTFNQLIQLFSVGFSPSKIILTIVFIFLLWRVVTNFYDKKIYPISLLLFINFLLLAFLIFGLNAFVLERNWIHLIIIIGVELAILINDFSKKITTQFFIFFCLTIYALNYILFLQKSSFLAERETVKDDKQLFFLLQKNGVKSIFFNDLFIKNHLDFYSLKEKQNFEYYTNNQFFSYATKFDSTKKFDAIIKNNLSTAEINFEIPNSYYNIFSTKDWNVYLRK